MKKFRFIIRGILTVFFFSATFSVSHAQLLKKIKEKAEKAAEAAAEEVVEDVTGKKDDAAEPAEEAAGKPGRAAVKPAFDFIPGDSLLFFDDLSNEKPGSMPHRWKTSGSGEVVTFPGIGGNWLLLNEFTTYKLDTLLAMPTNFSLEFDIVTRSDQADDLHDFSFGFSRDNSVRGYNDNLITETTIHYWNEEVINSSDDTESYNSRDFDLAGYANAVMHVSIQVKGSQMKVYLDKEKVLDTRMFNPGTKKYFYMSTSTDIENQAQIAISNFKLMQ